LTSPAPYELVFFSVVAISLLQRALQTGSAVVAYPVMSVTANFIPVVVGLTVLGEHLPGDWRDALFWIALAMLGAGIGLLGSQRAVVIVEEGPQEPPARPATSPLEEAGHPAG
jgi:multidrug transporter EmrE-like cation transporter